MIGKIEIPGKPIPLARARAGRHGFYDSQCLVKSNIIDYVKKLVGDQKPHENALSLVITFYMPIPKSWSKKRQLAAIGKPHIGPGDVSNFLKFYEDCFNGYLWSDDRIIYSIDAVKLYDLNPRTIILIDEY